MDHCFEALIGVAGAHGDAFELLQVAEDVLDEVAAGVEFATERQRLDGSAISPLKAAVSHWRHVDAVIAVARHQLEGHQIAQRIGERQDHAFTVEAIHMLQRFVPLVLDYSDVNSPT